MKVAFGADASLRIGIGHVMRSLTLADALAARGADCQIICCAREGNHDFHFHHNRQVCLSSASLSWARLATSPTSICDLRLIAEAAT